MACPALTRLFTVKPQMDLLLSPFMNTGISQAYRALPEMTSWKWKFHDS